MAKKYQYSLPFEDPGIQIRLEGLAAYFGEDYIYNGKPSPKRLVEAIAYGRLLVSEAQERRALNPQFHFLNWSSTRWQSLLVAVWVCLEASQYAVACELVSLLSLRDESDAIWREQIAYFRATDWFVRYELLQELIKSNQPFRLDYDNGSGVESHVIRHAFLEYSPHSGVTWIRAYSTNRRSRDTEPIRPLAHNYRFALDRIVTVEPTSGDKIEWLGSMTSIEVTFELPGFQQYLRHPYDLDVHVLSDGRRCIKRRVYDTPDLREDLARYLPNFEVRSPISIRSYFSRIAQQMHVQHL